MQNYNFKCSQLLLNNRAIYTIKKRQMSANEYRLAVDADYRGNEPRPMVVVYYRPEAGVCPKSFDASEFDARSIESLARAVAI